MRCLRLRPCTRTAHLVLLKRPSTYRICTLARPCEDALLPTTDIQVAVKSYLEVDRCLIGLLRVLFMLKGIRMVMALVCAPKRLGQTRPQCRPHIINPIPSTDEYRHFWILTQISRFGCQMKSTSTVNVTLGWLP